MGKVTDQLKQMRADQDVLLWHIALLAQERNEAREMLKVERAAHQKDIKQRREHIDRLVQELLKNQTIQQLAANREAIM